MKFVVPAIAMAAVLALTACGGGNSPSSSPLPTASLNASQTTVSSGADSMLTWTSANATACTASGGWSGTLAANGTQSTGALTANTSYSLVCSGAGGTSTAATASITVAAPPPVPTVTLTANPTTVASGGTSALTWTSTDATACTASGGWSGTLAASGTQSTGAITANTSYSLACSGTGGSATATAAVTLVTMGVTPATAALARSATQQYTATVPGAGAATWTVDGIAGGNAAVGTVSATGLYTAGTTPGSHTVLATSNADISQSASAVAIVTDLAGVYTFHNNLARDGSNTKEYALTTSTVNTAHFGKMAACPTDGAIYAQPLWVANLTVNGARHDVVFVATEHDSLYAFDANASPCAKLYSVSLIDAAHGGSADETSVPSLPPNSLVGVQSGDVAPEIGVTGTPVIDPATNILYVVSKSVNAAHTVFTQRLHAIDMATGNEKTGSPLLISGTYPGTGDHATTVAFDSKQEFQRAGLAFANGMVYVAFTAHEDRSPWYGWMMSYQYDDALTQKAVLNVAPNVQRGGIWMSGGAPAVDSSNKMYVLTGNGTFTASGTTAPNNDYGDSLIQLTPSLTVSQYFTPTDEASLASNDFDFGSGGAAVLADLPAGNTVTHALICGAKDSYIYVINRDLLGGYGDTAAVQKISFTQKIFATGAFWNNHFFLGGVGGPLRSYLLNTTNAQFSLASSSSHVYGFAGATPSVSSNTTQNGVVWTLDTGQYCTKQSKGCGPVVLYAHDASNMATELWNSAAAASDAAGFAVKFTVPTVANGRVYVGTRGNNAGGAVTSTSTPGELDIYGLKP